MAEGILNKGKVSRKLVPYAGGLLLVVATIGFVMQAGMEDGGPTAEQLRKEKEETEALRKGVSEDDARRQLAEKAKRIEDQKPAPPPERPLPPPPMDLPPPAPGGVDRGAFEAYAAAKKVARPASRDKMSMVAFEGFPEDKKVPIPNPVPPEEERHARPAPAPAPGAGAPAAEDPNREWADKTKVRAGVSEALLPDVQKAKSVLLQGTVINAVTRTGLNTKMPGQIVASVTQDVYDSLLGRTVLLPRGATLVGEYNTSVRDGQNRVMMAFTRLIYPSGASVRLGAMSASDALGLAGVKGEVNTYFWRRLGSTLMLAALASVVEGPDSVTVINMGGESGNGGANPAGDILADAARKEIERSAQVTPDISLAHGSKVTLILAADLVVPRAITNKIPTED